MIICLLSSAVETKEWPIQKILTKNLRIKIMGGFRFVEIVKSEAFSSLRKNFPMETFSTLEKYIEWIEMQAKINPMLFHVYKKSLIST